MISRYLYSIFLCCFSLSAICGAGELTLWQQGEPLFLSPARPKSYDYIVNCENLSSAGVWNPNSENFPLELSLEARRAKKSLASVTTNQIDLQEVRIIRIQPSKASESCGGELMQFTNKWCVVFTFTAVPQLEFRSKVLLLDGSYAREKEGSETKDISLPGRFMGATVPKNAIDPQTPKLHTFDDPWAMVKNKDFNVPKVQWDLDSMAFPLEVRSAIRRAKDALSKNHSIPMETVSLAEICMSRYMPAAALEMQHLDAGENLHHWGVTLTFAGDSDSKTARYQVRMLLDGTILD